MMNQRRYNKFFDSHHHGRICNYSSYLIDTHTHTHDEYDEFQNGHFGSLGRAVKEVFFN